MASLEKLSATLEVTEQKKYRLGKAILSVALQCKGLKEHLETVQQSFEKCGCEIDSKEKHLDFVRKSVSESNDDLELLRIGMEERLEELEVRENQLKLFHEKQIGDLKLKEEKLGSIRRSIMKEVELREQKMGEQCKLVEGLFQKIEFEHKQFEPIRKSMDQRLKEISAKEKHFESRSKELHLVQDWIERRAKELDTKEEDLEERYKEFKVKEKQLDDAKKLNEEWSGELDSREKQFDSVKEYVIECCYKGIKSKEMQVELEEKLLEERSKELELKEKQLEDRSKELQLKEEKFANTSNVKIERPGNMPSDNRIDSSYANIQLSLSLDGKSLQMFLNENSNVMSNEICNALQLSLDPAKLVLDAMEGFYPPHSKKGDTEFEGNVVRKSCIFLLEKLRTISVRIQPYVKEEALKLAHEWKAKMAKNSLEVLGFLQLLASYKLTSAFDADELWNLFEIVAEHKAAPILCRVLGFVDRIPDLIQNFVKKKKHLVALRYICAFELIKMFPPLPLFKEYCRKVAYSVQDSTVEERGAAVIRAIVGQKLETPHIIRNLEEHIEELIALEDTNRCTVPASDTKLTSSVTTNVLNNASILPKTVPAPATTMAFFLAKMDGQRLQVFLNEHLEEHELLRNEVSSALEMSIDSARLVLDAMQGFYPPHLKKKNMEFEAHICRRSCILLIEEFTRLSPQITHKVRVAAKKIAVDWKEKMRSDIEILGFLQIVGAYRMASAFNVDELSTLLGSIVHLRHAPELRRVLGSSENTPDGNVLRSQEMVDQSSAGLLLSRNIVASSSRGPQFEFKSLCTNTETKEVSNSIRFSLDPAKLVLDALQGCYYSHLKGNTSLKEDVLSTYVILLEQLIKVSPEIKPHVQEEAMLFVVDWKLEMLQRKKPLKVIVFLQFVAIYKLASKFSADELLGFLGDAHWHEQAINLFPILELADKIPDFIEKLIKRQLRLAAIKFIYAYGLVDKFPPVPLLKGHLTYSKKIGNQRCNKDNNSLRAQKWAIKKEEDALRDVIKCITEHGLESEFSPENLKTRLELLGRKSKDRRLVASHRKNLSTLTLARPSDTPLQKQDGKKCFAPTPTTSSQAQAPKKAGKKRSAQTPAPASSTQSRHKQMEKRPRTAISIAEPSEATCRPVHSAQSSQRPSHFSSGHEGNPVLGAPYLRPPAEYSRRGESTPVISHMSHSNTMPFAAAVYHSGHAANFYGSPSEAPASHHLWHYL